MVEQAPGKNAVLVASLPNFEQAMFGTSADGEKPYGAWEKVRKDKDGRKKVTQLLSYLVEGKGDLPSGTLRWHDQVQLAGAVQAYLDALEEEALVIHTSTEPA